jgi:hypothetical protein
MSRALAVLAMMAAPAMAQMPCAPTAEMHAGLRAEKYHEEPIALGAVSGNEATMQVFVNVQTRTWTIVIDGANGMSCIVVAGQSWRFAKVAVGNGI